MPDTKKYLDIDGLTEYHETAGHSADIADGSITTEKLAPMAVTTSKLADKSITTSKLASKAVDSYSLADGAVTWAKLKDSVVDTKKLANLAVTEDKLDYSAVTTTKLADGAVTFDKITPSAISHIQAASIIAADSQASQALTTLHIEHRTLTPEQMLENDEYANITNRLCWIKGSYIEVAAITFLGDLQSGQITLYAGGMDSIASGKLGIDTSWTIS